MCGIIAYQGHKEAYPILLQGLQALEYRGYDSAGIVTRHENALHLIKRKGRVQTLSGAHLPGTSGIGHTRWATHGKPSDHNAHPFFENTNHIAIVHNGIIENYLEIKEQLRKEGVTFSSDTDSEVIAHLIKKNHEGSLKQAVQKTLKELNGAYAFCAINTKTNEIVAARNGSPLLAGIGEQEVFLASDASAIIAHTKNILYLEDFEIAHVENSTISLTTFNGEKVLREPQTVNWTKEQTQKQGFKHFMLKEIHEQKFTIEQVLKTALPHIKKPKRITITACGSALIAGMMGKYYLEEIAKIPTRCEVASELRYKDQLYDEDELVIAISQSGETADTLASINEAKRHNAATLGIINVQESTIARTCDQVVYLGIGPEISVASTKAVTAMSAMLLKLAYHFAQTPLPQETANLTKHIEEVLNQSDHIRELAQKYYLFEHMFFLGRNSNYPVAQEGALKLKETSYLHAESYPGGELKHGPLALISERMATLVICPQDNVYEKMLSNMQEIKARGGPLIALATKGDQKITTIANDILFMPNTTKECTPLIATILLQLFAYHIADLRECDIDKPRNLAKSVTVE